MSISPQKRTASEAQLPIRWAKQRRTSNTSIDSRKDDTQGEEGVLSRLLMVGRSTIAGFFQRHTVSSSEGQSPPTCIEQEKKATHQDPVVNGIPNGQLSTSMSTPIHETSITQEQPVASGSNTIPSSRVTVDFNFDDPSPSRSSASCTPDSPSRRSENTGDLLTESVVNGRSRFRNTYGVPRRHIHDKLHKARVKESLEWKLYELQRTKGYQSDFDTFRGYLAYRQRLAQFDVSPKGRSATLEDVNAQLGRYFGRAVEKAKKSLESPRPPRPFSPTIDQLRIATRARDEAITNRLRPKRPSLPDRLPDEIQLEVDRILSKTGVLSKTGKEQVSDRDISRLLPAQWLNDEIINFYGQLIMNRVTEADATKENGKKPLNVHYFSTFFWTKLKSGYEKGRLAKWTKKLDIFSKDVILIPVNHNNSHWTAAAINFRRKRIESYDSMDMDRADVYKTLRMYLDEEHKNKKKKPFDFTGWTDHIYEETPQQENGYDCGVFTCQILETLSRGEESFNFSQKDMPYLRQRMVWEIGRAKLGDPC